MYLLRKSSRADVEKAVADPDKIVIFSTSPAVRVALGDAFNMPDGAFVEGKMIELLRRRPHDLRGSRRTHRAHHEGHGPAAAVHKLLSGLGPLL